MDDVGELMSNNKLQTHVVSDDRRNEEKEVKSGMIRNKNTNI